MANVELKVGVESNMPEVLEEDERALRKRQAAHEKAEKEIAKVLAKGDPLRALEQQHQRQLAALERASARSLDVTEKVEKAKAEIVERYEKHKTKLIEAEAQKQQAAVEQTGAKFTDLGKPIKNVSGLVGKLGGEAGGALGNVGKLGVSMLSTFAVGGPIALGIAGVGAGVGLIVSHLQEAKEKAAEAAKAFAAEWNDAVGSIEKTNEQLREQIRLSELLYGLTSEEAKNAAKAEDVLTRARRDSAAVEDTIAAKRERLAEIAPQGAAREARFIDEMVKLKADLVKLEEERLTLVQATARAERAAAEAAMLGDRTTVDPRDPTAGIGRPSDRAKGSGAASTGGKGFGQLGKFQGVKAAAAAQEEKLTGDDGSKFGVDVAKRAAEQRKVEEEMERGAMDAARRASVLAKQSQEDLANAIAEADPIAAIDRRMQVELEAIEKKLKEARALAKDEASAPAALQAAENLEKQKTAVTEKYAKQQSKKDGEMAIAGMEAAAAFGHGFKSFYETKDPKDLFKGILGAAAGVFSMLGMAPVGAGLGILGGFFRDGGPTYAHRLPQGRRGLATFGANNDGLPAILHPREVVIPEDVIAEDLGGMPEAMALAAGKGRSRGGRGATVINNTTIVRSFDTVGAFEGAGRLNSSRVERADSRLDSLEREATRSAARAPRSS